MGKINFSKTSCYVYIVKAPQLAVHEPECMKQLSRFYPNYHFVSCALRSVVFRVYSFTFIRFEKYRAMIWREEFPPYTVYISRGGTCDNPANLIKLLTRACRFFYCLVSREKAETKKTSFLKFAALIKFYGEVNIETT